MTAEADRLTLRRDMLAARMIADTVLACGRAAAAPQTVQAFDIRVRTTNGAPVPNAVVRVTDPGAPPGAPVAVAVAAADGAPLVHLRTDAEGDIIVRKAAGNWDLSAFKDWFVPEPAEDLNVALAANTLEEVTLVLDELRYELRVDANRDGVVDDTSPTKGVIKTWRWGHRRPGAIVLCNNDEDDDGVAVGTGAPDHADDRINGGNDRTHEVAPLEVFRVGPATAPSAATGWTATLEIMNDNEGELRVFNGRDAGDRELVGPTTATSYRFDVRVAAGPNSLPTQELGMEALSYPYYVLAPNGTVVEEESFDGRVKLRLVVRMTSQERGVPITYSTGAEVRVAPWLMPNHRDDADTVYVVNVGADAEDPQGPAGLNIVGNSGFRAALAALLDQATDPALEVYDPGGAARDRWMQDCMEIGYSVVPHVNGDRTRHRVDSVMRAYRMRKLRHYPKSLLTADLGFHFPGASLMAAAYTAATTGGARGTPAYAAARAKAIEFLNAEAAALLSVPERGTAADEIARQMEATLIQLGNYDAITITALGTPALNAVRALGPPYSTIDIVPLRRATALATQAMEEAATDSTTYDSNGNLECTPPCRATGTAASLHGIAGGPKDYPWGRIYYGRGDGAAARCDADTRGFLAAQQVQFPIEIDTGWLSVGHVDEMMSFIPVAGNAWYNRWRLLLACPLRAYAILDDAPDTHVVLRGRHFHTGLGRGRWDLVEMTAAAMRAGNVPTEVRNAAGTQQTADELRSYNCDTIQPRINAVAARLVDEIGVRIDQIIHVPVIFAPAEGDRAHALTADMVNMLVVNGRCIVPKPYGPTNTADDEDLFEEEVVNRIEMANDDLEVTFIDDWFPYHLQLGEIHCGTNTWRYPNDPAAWLASEAAEWWRFIGTPNPL